MNQVCERNQGTLTIGILPAEQSAADIFYGKLSPLEKNVVDNITRVLDTVARSYLSSTEVDRIHSYYRAGGVVTCIPFFSMYAVGGMVTKDAPRPDIDLLVATNMRYFSWGIEGNQMCDGLLFSGEVINKRARKIQEKFVKPLLDFMLQDFSCQMFGELPNSYRTGAKDSKYLLRFAPRNGQQTRPFDISYANKGCTNFLSEEEFISLDVDESKQPLARVPLYRAYLKGYVPPPITV